MSSAYISRLKRELAIPVENSTPAPPDLRARFVAWYAALPEISKLRPFAMVEFEQALGTQGKWLSPILLDVGWQRKRQWTGGGQYPRFWVPPGM